MVLAWIVERSSLLCILFILLVLAFAVFVFLRVWSPPNYGTPSPSPRPAIS